MALPRLPTLLFVAAMVVGCSSEPASPSAADYMLDDGTQVSVRADGGFTIAENDRTLLSLADAASITVRRYDEIVNSLFATWSFERDAEVSEALTKFEGSSSGPNGVTIHVSGPSAKADIITSVLTPDVATLVRIEVTGFAEAKSIAVPLSCDPDASYYGFGEQYNGTNQRGEAFSLFVSEQGIGRDGPPNTVGTKGSAHTTYLAMPYFLDARGFGALVRTSYRTLVDLCATDSRIAWIEVESGDPVEIVVFHGPTPKDVIRQLGDEVGRPKAPPAWAYSPWISAQGGRDAVLARVAMLEQNGIQAGAIWSQDWTGKRMNVGGGYGVQYRWVADETLYPDLAGMITDLHTKGYKFLAYANPFVMPNLDHWATMSAGNMLIQKNGQPYLHASPAGDSSHPDPTNPAATEYVRGQLADMVTNLGIDGWMADFAEWVPLDAEYQDGSDPRVMHNRYPTEWHRMSREAMDKVRPDGDWAVFSRSGWTGEQAVAQIVWAGDQEATWTKEDGLPTVVPALLNLGLSGFPFVTHDIAGFSGGPSTKELYMRWTELGAFTPIMRTHDGNMKETNWSWDKDLETIEHFKRFTKIHAALAADFMALATDASQTGAPILRHLMLEFPDDPEARNVSDQFLIGDKLLVAPVLEQGASTRSVYLPKGTWFDVWTGQSHAGGARVMVDAPMGKPPVFSRDIDRMDLRAL
ncbi:MAG TPA: glycoside hydrolase family 31 protein [Polyangium sp.]|nr:glycoside hydrolase family 31 protein [Polyangium sp.]